MYSISNADRDMLLRTIANISLPGTADLKQINALRQLKLFRNKLAKKKNEKGNCTG